MKTTKTRTFKKGTEFHELIDFIIDGRLSGVETNTYQPEGTDYSGGEPSPYDPVCETQYKYTITITKHESI